MDLDVDSHVDNCVHFIHNSVQLELSILAASQTSIKGFDFVSTKNWVYNDVNKLYEIAVICWTTHNNKRFLNAICLGFSTILKKFINNNIVERRCPLYYYVLEYWTIR